MPGKPWRFTVTGISSTVGYPSSGVFVPDYYIRPFNIGIGTICNTGAATFSVEHTFDDTSTTFISSALTWFPNTGITAKSTNTDGNYAYPVTGIRLNVTAGSTGTIQLVVIQAG